MISVYQSIEEIKRGRYWPLMENMNTGWKAGDPDAQCLSTLPHRGDRLYQVLQAAGMGILGKSGEHH